MDAETTVRARSALPEYLYESDRCVGWATNCSHLQMYVCGQFRNLDRKGMEPIADAVRAPPAAL